MNSPIHERLTQVVADVFEVPESEIALDSTPDTIEAWDSLHHLSLVLALEEEFGVQFDPDEVEELLSVEIMIRMLELKQGGNGASNGR